MPVGHQGAMLWRVRTTLPDRPGALAVLAQHCGAAGVNILGLQIFPGVEAVTGEPGVRPVTLRVDPAWQRRGVGTHLLVEAARLANAGGAVEIVLTARADNQAVLPVVLAAGLRGRIRMAVDVLTVRIPVHELKPIRA